MLKYKMSSQSLNDTAKTFSMIYYALFSIYLVFRIYLVFLSKSGHFCSSFLPIKFFFLLSSINIF